MRSATATASAAMAGDDAGGHDREVEDAVDVVVLGDRVRDVAAVGGAGDDHADLDVERHPPLDDARHGELGERRVERRPSVDRAAGPCRRSRAGPS